MKDLIKIRENIHSNDPATAAKRELVMIEIDINKIKKAVYTDGI